MSVRADTREEIAKDWTAVIMVSFAMAHAAVKKHGLESTVKSVCAISAMVFCRVMNVAARKVSEAWIAPRRSAPNTTARSVLAAASALMAVACVLKHLTQAGLVMAASSWLAPTNAMVMAFARMELAPVMPASAVWIATSQAALMIVTAMGNAYKMSASAIKDTVELAVKSHPAPMTVLGKVRAKRMANVTVALVLEAKIAPSPCVQTRAPSRDLARKGASVNVFLDTVGMIVPFVFPTVPISAVGRVHAPRTLHVSAIVGSQESIAVARPAHKIARAMETATMVVASATRASQAKIVLSKSARQCVLSMAIASKESVFAKKVGAVQIATKKYAPTAAMAMATV